MRLQKLSTFGVLLLILLLLSESDFAFAGKKSKSKGGGGGGGGSSRKSAKSKLPKLRSRPPPHPQSHSPPPLHKHPPPNAPPGSWRPLPQHQQPGQIPREFEAVCFICQAIDAFTDRVVDRLLIRLIESLINQFVDLLPDAIAAPPDPVQYQTLILPSSGDNHNSNSARENSHPLIDLSLGHSSDLTLGLGHLPQYSHDNSVDLAVGGSSSSSGKSQAKPSEPHRDIQTHKLPEPTAETVRTGYGSTAFGIKVPDLTPYKQRDGLPYRMDYHDVHDRKNDVNYGYHDYRHRSDGHHYNYPSMSTEATSVRTHNEYGHHYDSYEQNQGGHMDSHTSHTHSPRDRMDYGPGDYGDQSQTHTIDLDSSNFLVTFEGNDFNPDFLYNGARKRKKRQ